MQQDLPFRPKASNCILILSTAHAAIRLNSIYYSKSSLLYLIESQDLVGEILVRASIAYAMKDKVRAGANICTHVCMLLVDIDIMNDVSSNSIFVTARAS